MVHAETLTAASLATAPPDPGWRAILTSPLRMAPNLLVIGAQKAGTTSLHALLAEHPEIVMSRIKECDELVRQRPSRLRHRAFFPIVRPFASPRLRWAGESTPYYMFHPEVPARAAALLPGVRAIAVLRDPAERAWSHYRHAVRHGLEDLGFEEALEVEESRVASSPWSHRHHSYFARGCYAPQLERWFAALGRERVLVLEFDELRSGDGAAVHAIERFLGLSTPLRAALPLRNHGGRAHPEIPDRISDVLRGRFATHVLRVERLLGRRFRWAGD